MVNKYCFCTKCTSDFIQAIEKSWYWNSLVENCVNLFFLEYLEYFKEEDKFFKNRTWGGIIRMSYSLSNSLRVYLCVQKAGNISKLNVKSSRMKPSAIGVDANAIPVKTFASTWVIWKSIRYEHHSIVRKNLRHNLHQKVI